ncbi:MAG: hypothetical protein ACI8RZ_001591 [Myxococcota bacterium]|jgi:hypothetical protein
MGSRLRRRPTQDLLSPEMDGQRPEQEGPGRQGPGRGRQGHGRGNADNVRELPERQEPGREQGGPDRGGDQGLGEQGGGDFLGNDGGLFGALGNDLAGITRAIESPVVAGVLESAPPEVGELIGAANEMGVGGGPMDWLGDLAGGAPGGAPGGEEGGPVMEAGPKETGPKAPGDGPPTDAGTPPTGAPAGAPGGPLAGSPAGGSPAGGAPGGGAPEGRGGPERTRVETVGGGGGGGGASAPGGGGGSVSGAQAPGGARAQLAPARPVAGRVAQSSPAPVVADPAPALGNVPGPGLAPISGSSAAPSFRPESGSGQAAQDVQPGTLSERHNMEVPAPSGMSDLNFEIPDHDCDVDESASASAGVAESLFAEASTEPLIEEAPAYSGGGPSGEGIVGNDTGLNPESVGSVDNTVNISAAGQAPSAGAPVGGEGVATPISGAGQLNTAATQTLTEQAPPDLGTLDTSGLAVTPVEGTPTGAAVSVLPTNAPLQVSTPNYPGGSDSLPSASGYTPTTPSTESDRSAAQQTLDTESAALDPIPGERQAQIDNDIAPQQAQGQTRLEGPTQQSQTDAQGAVTRGGEVVTTGQTGMTDASSQLDTAVSTAAAEGSAALSEACVSPQPAGITGGTPDQISGPLGERQSQMLESVLPSGPVPLEMPPGAVSAMEGANTDLLDTLATSTDPTPQFDQLVNAELPESGFVPPDFEEAVDTAPPQINANLSAPAGGGGGGVPTPIEGEGAMAAIEGEISAQTAEQTEQWQDALSGGFEDNAISSFEDASSEVDGCFTGTADSAQDVLDDYQTSRPEVEPADQAAEAQSAFQQALDDSASAQSEMSGGFQTAQGEFDASSMSASGDFSSELTDARSSHLDATTAASADYDAGYEQARTSYAADHGAALGTMQGTQSGAMQGAQQAWSVEQETSASAMSAHQAGFERQRGALDAQTTQARTQAQSTLDADVSRYQTQARSELDSQMTSARSQVDGQVTDGMCQVDAELQSGIDGFETEIQTGVAQAESERSSAESEADRKREEDQDGGVLSAIGDAVSSAWNAICDWISERFEAAKNAINGFLEAAKNAALGVLEAARSAALGILEGIRDAVHGIISAVCEALRTFISAIADALRAAIDMVVQFITAAIQLVASALNTLIESFQVLVNALVQGLISVVSLIDEDLGAQLSAAGDVFLGAFNGLCDTAQSAVQGAADGLTAQVQAAGDALSATITAAEDGLISAIDTAESALHAATDAAFDAAVSAVNAAFDIASAAITAAFELARAAVTAWFDAQLAMLEAAREWVDAHIHEAISALQAAGEWLSDRWEDLKEFAADAWVFLEKGLVAFWNSPWRDVILGALLTAVAIGAIALITVATGGLALPLLIGLTAVITGGTAAAVYGGGELAARRAYVDLATNHGEFMIPESQMMEDPNNPGQMIPDPSLAANDWYSDTLGSVERNPDGTMSYMRDGELVTVDPTDEAAVREMAAYGFARDADGNLIGESMGDSLNDSAALAAAKGTEWAISGAVIAATGGLMPVGTVAQPLSTAARVGYAMLIDGGLSTVSDVVTQPLTSAIEDSIDSDERGFGDSLSEWTESRTHERVPIQDADGNVVGYARGDELSGWEIAGQEALSAGANIVTAGAGGWAETLTENREFRSQVTEFLTEQAVNTTEGGASEALTYTVNSMSGRSQEDFSWQGLMDNTMYGAAGSAIQGTASEGTTHLGESVGHSIAGTQPVSNTSGTSTQQQDTGPTQEQSTSTDTSDLDSIINATIMDSAGTALLNTSDSDAVSADQANVVNTTDTDTVTVGDTTLDTSGTDRIEVSSDASTVETTSGDTQQTVHIDGESQGTDSAPIPMPTQQDQQAASQTSDQTPIQQRIDQTTGVDRGADHDASMADMAAYYQQMETDAQSQDTHTQDIHTQDIDQTPGSTRTPTPEVQGKADDVMATLQLMIEHAEHNGEPQMVQGHQAAVDKVRQILSEQSPGITDAMKMAFLTDYHARLNDFANQDADGFNIVRDTVNAASVKDENGDVQSNPYLRQGETIPLQALQDAGPMSRLYGTDKVFGMLTPDAQAELASIGVDADSFGQFLSDNPDYNLSGNFDASAHVEGYNNTAWWGLQSEGEASNVTELIDALALTPENYPQGGVRFNVDPNTAHDGGMTKPTAFDGLFPEWAATEQVNPFGVTAGGKQEGVAARIPISRVDNIEVFAGVPDQLVNKTATDLQASLTGQGNTDAAALVRSISGTDLPNAVRLAALNDLQVALDNPSNASRPVSDIAEEVLSSRPEYSALRRRVETNHTDS